MTQAARVYITTPPGRLVAGDLYKANDKDAEGRPLLIKNGPDAGKPRVEYYFALAIPKEAGHTHWAHTEWGRKIWEVGHGAFPQGQAQHPSFAWKIIDGDSQIPNLKGKKPCDREGWAGCWVLNFSGGFAPRIFNSDGTQAIVEPGAVKLGYWAQVYSSVDGNNSMQKPGIYLNHSMVALVGYGPEIVVGPDASSVGFGGAPLPPGASAAPVGGFAPPAAPGAPAAPAAPAPAVAAAPVVPPHPAAPAVATPPSAVPSAPAPMPSAAAVPVPAAAPAPAGVTTSPSSVTPHPGFVTPPAPPAAPAAPAGPTMTAAAGGVPYESYKSAGWTDEQLRANGYML